MQRKTELLWTIALAFVAGVVVERYFPSARRAVIAALLPIMRGSGTGSEVMRRIAAPMIMITAPLVSMLVIPVLYVLWNGAG